MKGGTRRSPRSFGAQGESLLCGKKQVGNLTDDHRHKHPSSAQTVNAS